MKAAWTGDTSGKPEPDRVVKAHLAGLSKANSIKFPHADPQIIWDAVVSCLLGYCDKPSSFDPSREVSLRSFLVRGAGWKIRNEIRAGERRGRHQAIFLEMSEQRMSVALPPSAGYYLIEAEVWTSLFQLVLQALPDPVDQEILSLCMQGERRTAVFATALGLTQLPVQQQRRKVKQTKDRIFKHLKRTFRKSRTVPPPEDRPSASPCH